MNKYEQALNEIKADYDAYYIVNKYQNIDNIGDDNTHKSQFIILKELNGDRVKNALNWIMNCYDCYYKDDYADEKGTAFEYLRNLCKEKYI